MSNRWFVTAIMLIASLAFAACGGEATSEGGGGNGGGDNGAASGQQGFYDGTLRLGDDTDTVIVSDHGGQEHELQRDAGLTDGQLRAYEEADTRVRVSYEERDGQQVATQIEPAPGRAEGLESAEGEVTAVSEDSVSLQTPDGLLQFNVAEDVRGHLDLVHLREHMEAGDPVIVYYEEREDGLYMKDYEDA